MLTSRNVLVSVLAGANIGAVKNPLMVIVRPQEQYGLVQFLENIDYVIWHWRTHRDDGRIKMGIMSMSVMLGNVQNNRPARMSRDDEEALDNIRKRLAECIKAGLLPITATGNDGGVSLLDEFTHLTATDRAR